MTSLHRELVAIALKQWDRGGVEGQGIQKKIELKKSGFVSVKYCNTNLLSSSLGTVANLRL